MVCRLIDFALVVLKLWMFKVRGIIVISKIEFFKFSGTERVKENKDLVLRIIATLKRSLVSLSNIFKKCFDFLSFIGGISSRQNLMKFFCTKKIVAIDCISLIAFWRFGSPW